METLYFLLPLSLVFVFVIGWAFWWAVTSGQFEDSDDAAQSILRDNDNTTAPLADEAASAQPSSQRCNEPGIDS